MLVLTRRENEKIVFPEVGITVELVAINGSRARIGVQAPAEVRILRHEIAEREGVQTQPTLTFPLERTPQISSGEKSPNHQLRNHLNTTTIAGQLLRRQIDAGMMEDAEATVRTLLQELELLQHKVLDAPAEPVAPPEPAVPQQLHALLVEDDVNEQSLLAGFLRMAGFKVTTAGNGQEAMEFLLNNPHPDIVLLDMLMPQVDGPTAVNEIRSHAELAGLKIFAVSGTSPMKLGVETGPAGINRWFHKPINPEELAREMARDLAS